MNTNLFKTAIAALALLVAFNSCKKDDDKPSFPAEDIKLLIDDGRVFAKQDSLRDEYFYSGEKEGYSDRIAVGTTPDNLGSISLSDVEPFTKYYWCVRVRDRKNSNPDEYIESEIRSFYYVTPPQITEIHNVEGDWAAIVKWEQSDYMKATKLTLTPDKECKYDNTPIDLSTMTDSCYISAGGEFNTDNQKYAVYHQWWDDSKAQYYEPVIYSFRVTYNGEIDGHSFTIDSKPKKYIFLDRAKYAADRQFNVYRMGQIGNRTWLLEDLRGLPTNENGEIMDNGHLQTINGCSFIWDTIATTEIKEIFNNWQIVTSPLGFKARLYSLEDGHFNIIPEGFHLATDDDWQDLEYTYGVEKSDINNYSVWESYLGNSAKEWNHESIAGYNHYALDTITFVGVKNNIFEKLISDNEWKSNDSLNTILHGYGGFNARPYGVADEKFFAGGLIVKGVGYSVAFLTSTNDPQNEGCQIIRYLWSPNHGIGRINRKYYWDNLYLYRCVKDE